MRVRESTLLAVAVATLSLTWLPRLRGPIDLRWDAAVYYELGASLVEGRGYRLLNEPGEIEAVTYPPALPAFVALHQKLIGSTDPVVVGPWLRRSFVALWVGYLLAAYALLRTRFRPWLALFGLALCGLHIGAIWMSDRLYADVPFAALAALFIVVAEGPQSRRSTFATWAIGALAFLTRTVGLALFAGWIGEALLNARWKTAVTRLVLAALPILAWQTYIVGVASTDAYRHPPYEYARAPYALYNVPYLLYQRLRDPNFPEQGSLTLAGMAGRAVSNARAIPAQLGGAVSASESEWVWWMNRIKASAFRRAVPWVAIPAGLLALGLVTIVGLLRLFVDGRRITVLAIAAYIAELCLLPWLYHWPRYLAGVAPLIVLGFVAGLAEIARFGQRMRLRPGRALAVGVGSGVLVLQSAALAAYLRRDLIPVVHQSWNGRPVAYRLFGYDTSFQAFDRGLEWIIARAQPQDVLVSSMAPWAYIRTGRHAVLPPLERDRAVVQRQLDSVPARYVIVDGSGLSFTRIYAFPVVDGDRDRWQRVYNDPSGELSIYERLGPSAP